MFTRQLGPRPEVLLLGGAGVKNFGDELMVRLWLNFYARANLPVRVHASDPRFMTALMRDHFPHVEFVNLFAAHRRPNSFWEAFAAGVRAPARELRGMMPTTLSLVHLHGGGYLNTMWPFNGYKLGLAIALKRHFGCALVGTGIGLTPLGSPPEDTRDLFLRGMEEFDLFEVRDHPSFDLLRAIGVASSIDGLDDTYLKPVAAVAGPRTLHISCFDDAADMIEEMSHLPAETFEQFDRVMFWQCTPEDTRVLNTLRQDGQRIDLLGLRQLIMDDLPVSPGDVMITTRFHPHLLAARQGATGVFRGDGGYYNVKHGSIVALGSPFEAMGDRGGLLPLPVAGATAKIVSREGALHTQKVTLAEKILNLIS